MKYMLLIYSDENAWTEQERNDCMAESVKVCHELNSERKYVGASPLHSVETATSVRLKGGKRMITDGPFAETSEQLGGYYIVDVENLDEAIDIAARIPSLSKSTIEIRPVLELSNLPEPSQHSTSAKPLTL